jgi:hypothetical protein
MGAGKHGQWLRKTKMEPTTRVLIRLEKEILHVEHSKLFFMLGNSDSSTISCI